MMWLQGRRGGASARGWCCSCRMASRAPGPDHSSARMERFLQLCNDDADHLPGSSPAQRRQIASTFECAQDMVDMLEPLSTA